MEVSPYALIALVVAVTCGIVITVAFVEIAALKSEVTSLHQFSDSVNKVNSSSLDLGNLKLNITGIDLFEKCTKEVTSCSITRINSYWYLCITVTQQVIHSVSSLPNSSVNTVVTL